MTAALYRIVKPAMDDFARRVSAAPGDARVTSWVRSRAQNAAAGGADDSQHLIGTAADFVPRAPSTYASLAASLRARGLIVIDEGDHLHAQLFRAGAASSFIRAAIARGLIL